jgi:hypothetical protein
VCDPFLENIPDRSVVRYFRHCESVVIPSSVDMLSRLFVTNLCSVESVTFEAGCRLQRIEASAFSWSELRSIMIPLSIEVLSKFCCPDAHYFHQLHLNQIFTFNALKNQHFPTVA